MKKLDEIHNILYENTKEVSHTLLAKTMCEANLYRTEGYISPFTVYSIVYIDQSKLDNKSNKKQSFIAGEIGTETLCYLEQLGFLLRYIDTDEKKVHKYTKRLDKYIVVTAAIVSEPGIVGGKRRKPIHRRSKKKKRSKNRISRQKKNKSKRRYRNRKQS